MIIIVYTPKYGDLLRAQASYRADPHHHIKRRLGDPEYSYYFVLRQFMPALEEMGTVVLVTKPDFEVDAIYDICRKLGQECLFLSFTPPHKTVCNLRCPTIPVFAWEFAEIPDEVWEGDARNDWRMVLGATGGAVTHSQFAARALRACMGGDFPAVSCPSPIWDRFQDRGPDPERPARLTLRPGAFVVDTRPGGQDAGIAAHDGGGTVMASFSVDPEEALVPRRTDDDPPQVIDLGGVIYTSVLNPKDGRKNWPAIIKAFCRAFRDTLDATLILKFVHNNATDYLKRLIDILYQMTPFECRVIVLFDFLDDQEYANLIDVSTYAVNASRGEGQCLPLMEYMSSGKPAIAPRHTAMLDYVDEHNAFLVDSRRDLTIWPHDPREKIRATWHEVDLLALCDAFAESHKVASSEPERYAAMSTHARESLQAFCSLKAVKPRLQEFLGERLKQASHAD